MSANEGAALSGLGSIFVAASAATSRFVVGTTSSVIIRVGPKTCGLASDISHHYVSRSSLAVQMEYHVKVDIPWFDRCLLIVNLEQVINIGYDQFDGYSQRSSGVGFKTCWV